MGSERTDEIDLLEILVKVITAIRTNLVLIISFFVVGTLLGFAYYNSSKKIYESRMLISSDILTESYCKALMDDANQLIREGNLKLLGAQLGISESMAGQVSSIEVKSPLANEIEIAKESDRRFFNVIVEVYNQELLDDLQKGLIDYFENNGYVRKRVDQRREYLTKTIAKLDQEIKDLETLKTDVYTGEFFKKVNGNAEFDPTTINSKILDLTKEKITAQQNLELASSVHLVEGFIKFEKPSKPKLSLSLIAGSVVGLVFVGMLIAIKSIRSLMALAPKQS